MVMENENSNTEESRNVFPEVPDEAIVKPEDERPSKMTKRPEEELPGDENKHDDEGIDDSIDMDGDGSPD
jgi:hypothetical protein